MIDQRSAVVGSAAGGPSLGARASRMVRVVERLRQGGIGMALAFADQAFASGGNFLMSVLLAQRLGAGGFGVFTLLQLFLLVALSIQFALVITPMTSIRPKVAPQQHAAYLGVVAIHQLAMGLVTATTVLLVVPSLMQDNAEPQTWLLGLLVAIATFAAQLDDFVRRYLFLAGRPGSGLAVTVAARSGALCGIVLWVDGGPDGLYAIFCVLSLSYLVPALAACGLFERPRGVAAAMREVSARHWAYGRWQLAATLLMWLSDQAVIIALGWLLDAAAVGLFKGALSLLAITHLLFNGIENAVPAHAAGLLHRSGERALDRYLWRVGALICGCTLLFCVPLVLYAEPIMRSLLGPEFTAAGGLVPWLAGYYVVRALSIVPVLRLRVLEQTRPIFTGFLIGAVVVLVSGYPAIALFGLKGGAVALAAMGAARLLFLWWAARHARASE